MSIVAIPKRKKITVSEQLLRENRGIVILSIDEYKNLCERAVPIYYLKGKNAKALDKIVQEGIDEYNNGKSRKVKSLSEIK